jgi:hypothetical protein
MSIAMPPCKFLFTAIIAADELDFYTMLHQRNDTSPCFENHWPYILQATRGRGYVYKNADTRIYFYTRNNGKHDELIMVNMLGHCLPGLKLLQKYVQKNNLKLILKNIPRADLDYWQRLGYTEKKEPWSSYSQHDDNSFPECIYTLESLALMHLPLQPGQIRQCRASHAQEIRKYLRTRKIQVIPYERATHQEVVYHLLTESAEFLHHKGVDSRENVIDAHRFVFLDHLLHAVRLVHVEDGTIVGFNYLTVVNNTIYGNALIHNNESNLMRFCMWQGFNYLYNTLDQSQRYIVTIQGSETAGQYYWKKGFAPIKEISKTHLIWWPDKK